ncbi:hypothetical protein GLA29479_1955 [Lysobacter antibioticus]|uniref:Uncharacterized protein n=1 Tax=Lysobacter antibioticus TaxID=84531 RepID=A0A0S2F7A9_LYSAN|nr:hypothetical protein GLA29479_1955 [Lysobacter antibioticus]ALN79403.1 hypothetical protein LA76x_1244 [Lysobacter antibioticus]
MCASQFEDADAPDPHASSNRAITNRRRSKPVNTNPNISNIETATDLNKVEDKNMIAARV